MKISNPLTIIAVFAGLAEAFATIALIKLPENSQQVFLYFVMGFPTLLVILFFYTLHKNHKVLYGPSDYKDQSMFFDLIRESVSEEMEKSLLENSSISETEKSNVSKAVSNILESAENKTRKEQILGYLSNGRALTKNICEDLGVHHSYATKILRELSDSGDIKRLEFDGERGVYWELSHA